MEINNTLVKEANSEIKEHIRAARGLIDGSDHAGALEETLLAIEAQQVIIEHFWAVLGNPE